LAKQRRGASPRTVKKKATARKGAAPRSIRAAAGKAKPRAAAKSRGSSKPRGVVKPVARAVVRKAPAPRPQAAPPVVTGPAVPSPPSPPPRKPGFYEAVAIYERGVQALQRHDYAAAAELFRAVIERYPEERELLERARLYLRVCERETARQTPPPQTSGEHVYAATVALNAGDHASALNHLQRALTADADNDHAHYIMAAALSMRGRRDEALEHLRRSIALNPENRSQARQDPDLENIRGHEAFRSAIDTPPQARRKAAAATVRRR